MITTSIFLLIVLAVAESSKILFLLPVASKSHKYVFDPLIEELSTRNHELTVISPYKNSKPLKNVQELVIPLQISTDVSKNRFATDIHALVAFYGYKNYFMPPCEMYLKSPEVRAILKKGKQFDTVVVDELMNECALATAPLVAKTIMFLSTSPMLSWNKFFVPRPPSYVPNILLPYTAKMSFFQRLNNIFNTVGEMLIMEYKTIPEVDALVAKYVPEAPPVNEAMRQVDFVLTNADPVLISQRPSMPNIVNVGGMHCRTAKPLPKEFQDFVESSGEDGFIIFSLGSNAESRFLPTDKKETFIKTLGKLKQKVIWKYEETIENLPANIKVTQWLPQQDLLGHPKCRLFITHGGLLSLQETVYHGVPVVAIPLFGDQPHNVARVHELEIGHKFDLNQMTDVTFNQVVQKVLEDKMFKENMKRYSAIFRDQYQRPEKRAAFWVEYVIRHQGATHFRSAGEELNFCQYFLLDVIALITTVTSVVIFCCYKSAKFIFHKVRNCKTCRATNWSDKIKKN